jgi:hypothetical protein
MMDEYTYRSLRRYLEQGFFIEEQTESYIKLRNTRTGELVALCRQQIAPVGYYSEMTSCAAKPETPYKSNRDKLDRLIAHYYTMR